MLPKSQVRKDDADFPVEIKYKQRIGNRIRITYRGAGYRVIAWLIITVVLLFSTPETFGDFVIFSALVIRLDLDEGDV